MSQNIKLEIQNELADAIGSGQLTKGLQSRAENLLDLIVKPVRLTVLGLPDSGKSTLADLLLGKQVLGHENDMPTVQIKYGDKVKMTCTMPDGTKQVFDHCTYESDARQQPIFLEMEMPLPSLTKISLLEVVAESDYVSQRRATLWAAKRSDIMLWCTQRFDDEEQKIWSNMPDHIKDHGFLLLTKSDICTEQEMLSRVMSQLKTDGAEQFKQILSIDAKAAIQARSADGSIDKQLMAETGGRKLISAILRSVEQGKQAAYDQAEILLRQHNQFSMPAVRSSTQDAEARIDETQTSGVPVPKESNTEALSATAVANASEVTSAKEPDPAPVETPEVETTVVTELEPLSPKTRSAYTHAVKVLTDNGQSMAETLASNNSLPNDLMMEETSKKVIWLDDYLQDNGDKSDANLKKMLKTTADAADLVQLLELENSSDASMDAISLVVQLKRELELSLCG